MPGSACFRRHARSQKTSNHPETNIAPKNGWLEYYFPIGEAHFQGQAVSFREGNHMVTSCFFNRWVPKIGSHFLTFVLHLWKCLFFSGAQ